MKTRLEMNKSKAMIFLLLLTVAAISHLAKNPSHSLKSTTKTSLHISISR